MVASSIAVAVMLAAQPQTGRVHGRVLDPSGAVVVGAAVVVAGAGGRVADTKTDRQGSYAVDALPPGEYLVTAAAAGFADARTPVTITARGNAALDIKLTIAVQRHEIFVEAAPAGGVTDPSANASATIIKGKDLEALSDDPNELEAQLRALAGPGAGGVSGQIFVDGFSGGKLPPKSAIQEIRLNQNPYSAEFDVLGAGRIEIVTKPGSQSWHGRFLLDGNGSALNARNPFLADKPEHHSSFLAGTLSGPIGKTSTLAVDGELIDTRETAAIGAAVLDSSLNQATFSQAVPAPRTLVVLNPRVDLQPARNNTLSLRYRLNDDDEHANGVGQLSLASQAFDVRKTEHDVQASDLQVISARLLNDARFEFRQASAAQTARSAAPQLTVLGAFTGGGSGAGDSHTISRHIELHDYVSVSHGAHALRIGGRLRATAIDDDSRQNFNGTFTFASLTAFQITERGLQQGLTPAQIRTAGGGASQFAIVGGKPAVSNTMVDAGLFVQDDWRLRSNLTVSGGLRYETQNDIAARADIAPRVSVAWGFGTPPKSSTPAWVIRTGIGLFYDRVPQTLELQAMRLDGVRAQQFIVASPDFFPAVPSAIELAASLLAPTTYRIDPALVAPRTTQTGVTVERRFSQGSSTVSVGYLYSHGSRQLLSRNVDAAGGPQSPPSYQFESEGAFGQHQLTTNFSVRTHSWISFSGFYVLGSAHGNSSGAGSFPSNPLSLAADEGRSAFDVRQRFTIFAGMDLPGFRVVPFLTASSGQPFDITVGRDLNGDSIFNDRPAFASDLSRPTVVLTRFGAFDSAPAPGQTIIPRNFGTGPAQVSLNLRVMKPFVVHQHDTIRFDVVASNLLNRVNASQPIGSLSSPLFGQSLGLSSATSPSANRQIHVQLQFLF